MGNSWKNHEIEIRLASFLILGILLVISMSGLWLLYRTKARMDFLLRDKLVVAAKTAYKDYVRFGPGGTDSLWSSWRELSALNGLTGVRLINMDGVTTFEYNEYQPWNLGPNQPEFVRPAVPEDAFIEETLRLSNIYHRQGYDYRTAFYKLRPGNVTIALEFLAGEETGITQAVNILSSAVIAGLGLVLLIALLLVRKIFMPFRQMAAGARSIMGEKDSIRPESEVEMVTATYLKMVEQLKARGETLQALYENAMSQAENSELTKQQVVDSLDTILITTGKDGKVSSFNRAAAMAAGGANRGAVESWLKVNQLTEGISEPGVKEWESDDPRLGRRLLRARVFELKDNQGASSGQILAIEDITTIRQMEEQARLNEQTRLMAETSQNLLTKIAPEIAALKQKSGQVPGTDAEWGQHLAAVEKAVLDLGQIISYQPPGSLATSGHDIVVASSSMQKVMELVRRVAQTDSTVIITGESGTGKELTARAIHASSSRSGGPFVSINCGALPETLLESELFGYLKGAFTGAAKDKPGLLKAAEGGTFFMDEVGELPLAIQVKLLRVLQEREAIPVGGTKPFKVDARIITATNQNLEAMVAQGRFRKDLYFRLNVFPIELPPLRQRPEDIRPLAEHFLKKHCQRIGSALKRISRSGMELLMEYSWPGNIRELENIIERAVVLSSGTIIMPEHLIIRPTTTSKPSMDMGAGLLEISARAAAAAEKEMIKKTLYLTNGNKSQAAKMLKISYRVILKKIKDFGLEK